MWSELEKQFLRENCKKMSDAQIAKALRRSKAAVRKMRQRLGYIKPPDGGSGHFEK